MKRNLLIILCLASFVFTATAQYDRQICIETEEGVLTISRTANGKDMIMVSIASWDRMVVGTKYESCFLPGFSGRKFCMQISDKKQGHCAQGIGFGCSIFDCPSVPDPLPNRVDNDNRICAVTVKKLKGSVRIIFDDKVNWQSLKGHAETEK